MPAARQSRHGGFSLLEIVIALGVFAIFVLGIYAGIQTVYRIVYQARVQIIESGILNEQVEFVRNLSYFDVGLENGSPAGVMARTATTTKNGIEFTLTRTVRSIDDPYDGTIGGTPNDTAPADYKLVEIAVICVSCGQKAARTVTTTVAPKYLENNADNGALFIRVFDAAAVPVSGASVHLSAPAANPAIDLTDTTGNDGMLKLVDLPPGVGIYNIAVSKPGYTSEQTRVESESLPNPFHPPASVVAQSVSEVSFTIDRVSSFTASTMDTLCDPIGNVRVGIEGSRVIGTEPDTLKVDTTFVTDGSGAKTLADYEWDVYTFSPSGYDIAGSIPSVPLDLPPGVDQPVQLILRPNTAYSLLVSVRDNITKQPVSQATVHVTSTAGYDESAVTGVGYIRQTDWSGGSGQAAMAETTRYWSDDSGVDTLESPGNIYLRHLGSDYVGLGSLESSTFDLGVAADYISLLWEPFSQPAPAGAAPVRWQIATASTTDPEAWEYRGPDGTGGSYYTPTATAVNTVHNGDRYVRYRLWLSTVSSTYSPLISDMTLSYTNSCTPPGQAYFGGLSSGTHTVEVTVPGYQTYRSDVLVGGDTYFTVELVGV
ncbi:MAG: hypothetical protein UY92_C0004G0050 [Candidatus Magasanikbacteria bacterium GW2011_GWA2_56_11]|uniref:Uncharacterized protein n=1 Tax=Candidatus Magasanikbacteria bacterium GW2011_GWA2_56_11 TaxID=1619044 RepID=A0A0G2BB27_9BACT|nr:MAG: hypothetical protein UY92_C0004G0050 [Candidatus Magasanikbacteria bacterium GW2011_GWA2_56_11]